MDNNFLAGLSRRGVLAALGSAVTAKATARGRSTTPRPPHVVFIMADDMGHADLSCGGSRNIRTPHIDSLARDGVFLTDAYSSSCVCSPTRVALLTGCYPWRFRIGLEEPIAFNGDRLALPAGTPTLPATLRDRGYRTALVGKWHIGEPPATSPLDWGYDYFFGIHDGGTDYFAHQTKIDGHLLGQLYENRSVVEREGYLTDRLGDVALEQIDRAARGNSPLFLSLHFTAPHWPWQGPGDKTRTVTDARDSENGSIATYARMVESLDENVGRVLSRLRHHRMDRDTLVIFTSDNGGERYSDTWPLTGMKGELLEGGIRVPFIARWPGRIPRNSVCRQVMASMDVFPTLAAASGGDLPSSNIDGVNLLPILAAPERTIGRTIFWRHKARNQLAIRSDNWKYLRISEQEFLFDLEADQRERANQILLRPDLAARLKARLEAWRETMLPYPADSYSEDIFRRFGDRTGPAS